MANFKTTDVLLFGGILVGIWYFFFRKENIPAGSPQPTSFPIQSSVVPTQATTPYPVEVYYTQTPSQLQDQSTSLRAISPAIQIQEGGKKYISPYQIVDVQTPQYSGPAISFESQKYTALSSGFAQKLVDTGLAPPETTQLKSPTSTNVKPASSSKTFATGKTGARFY